MIRSVVTVLPTPEPSCELGQRCVARAGAWLDPSEIDRLRAGPLCPEHHRHVVATLGALPQWEPDADWLGTGAEWIGPTQAARSLARFLGYAAPEEMEPDAGRAARVARERYSAHPRRR